MQSPVIKIRTAAATRLGGFGFLVGFFEMVTTVFPCLFLAIFLDRQAT
jgi:hypothetical protein